MSSREERITMSFIRLLQLLSFSLTVVLVVSTGLREEFTWTRLSYKWPAPASPKNPYRDIPTPETPEDTISFPGGTNAGERLPSKKPKKIDYIYKNNIPMGANAWKDKVFLSVPRRRFGVPSTLNFVWNNETNRHNVPLIPYPDWKTNLLSGAGSSGYKFVSVYRVAIDECDRLWFVDTGIISEPENRTQIQPSAIVVMDLHQDQVIRRYVLTPDLLGPTFALASLTIDITKNKCDEAFAYIPDLAGYFMLVYSFKEDKAWKVKHNFFFLEPNAGDFNIGGHKFQWNDGIFSVALSETMPDGYKNAYFHAMSGYNMYKVSTKVLQDEAAATRSYHGDDFQIVGNKGPFSQTSGSVMHKSKKILFLNLVNQNAVGCWRENTPTSQISIIQQNNKTMIYPSDIKIAKDDIIVLTNKFPVNLYGTLNFDEINFRVWRQNIDVAVRGTTCE